MIQDELKENKKKIEELQAQIDIYGGTKITPKISGRIQELQDRLQYRLMELEKQGQEAKIDTLSQVLEEVRTVSNIIKQN